LHTLVRIFANRKMDKILKQFNKLRGTKKDQPISRKASVRGSLKKKKDKVKASLALSAKKATTIHQAALIVLNAKYLSGKFRPLSGVKKDGDKMEEMLVKHGFEVKIVNDSLNIGKDVQEFCSEFDSAKEIHFHYSGHGVDNARVSFDPNVQIRDREGKKFSTSEPYGDSMVNCGPDGDLYSVHDLKHDLVRRKPDKIVVTLDCCRDIGRAASHIVILRHKREMNKKDQQRIALIQGTSEGHKASDLDSFTQELHKVVQEENGSIRIKDIPKKVNQSWCDRNIDQLCKLDICEIGDNWENVQWPSETGTEIAAQAGTDIDMENVGAESRDKSIPNKPDTMHQHSNIGETTETLADPVSNMEDNVFVEEETPNILQKVVEKVETLEEDGEQFKREMGAKFTEMTETMNKLSLDVQTLKEENSKLKKEKIALAESCNEKAQRRKRMQDARKSWNTSSPQEDIALFFANHENES